MDRRKALKRSSLILGYAVVGGTATALLNGCKADPAIDWSPQYFTKDQALLAAEIAEMIMPATDTPGAKDAKVDRFMDAMLESYSAEEREEFLNHLNSFDTKANELIGSSFYKCIEADRIRVMDAMVEESKKENGSEAFNKLREVTVAGFCTSEVGATKFLKHSPVPGPYEGCVEYSTIGKTWAL